ncbi:MAG: 50S ribosomal protein L3 N(5)-glutamine methyltransferase [Ruminobacter sp.]|nr:50S ribosomal protein L3 N(5)-glutamine methyltransferase [Ruminobacter sp.]
MNEIVGSEVEKRKFRKENFPEDVEAEIVSELETINDVVRYVTSYMIENNVYLGHGTDSYWDEALYLVLCLINLDPPGDPETMNAKLTDREKRNIARALTTRVRDRIPTAYLTNRAWFCGIEFYVDERVIIPRSPIGELINNGFAPYLRKTPSRILDMCTGSGCIALACANKYSAEDVSIDAVDISEDALDVCIRNIYNYGLEDVVIPIKSDLFDALNEDDKYDLIVCNPPYVDAADMEDMPDEYRAEPELALAAGNDGLDLVKVIIAEAPYYLADDGLIFVEVGNSRLSLEAEFPEVEFKWVEFKNGGDGVFVMTYDDLIEYAPYFEQYRREK